MTSKVSRLALASAAGVACLLINDHPSFTEHSTLVTQADARVGNPLTPGSVAGVNRRTTRRAYRRDYYGTGAGVAAAGAVAAGAAATGAYLAAPAPETYPAPAATGPYLAAPAPAASPGPAATGAYLAAPAAPTYPESAPSFVHDAVAVPPGQSATVTDPATGRTCTMSTSGYHWCWTP